MQSIQNCMQSRLTTTQQITMFRHGSLKTLLVHQVSRKFNFDRALLNHHSSKLERNHPKVINKQILRQ